MMHCPKCGYELEDDEWEEDPIKKFKELLDNLPPSDYTLVPITSSQ